MGVSGTTTATTTIPSYEPLRRDSFRPPSLEAADNSLGLASSLSPVEEQVSTHLIVLSAAQYSILNIQLSSCYKTLSDHNTKNFIT